MLLHEPKALETDEMSAALARMISPSRTLNREIRPGVYEIAGFGSSAFLQDDYDPWPEFCDVNDFSQPYRGNYGVADNLEQVLALYPELEADPVRQFVVTFIPVDRADESPEGGWRWHKWGAYIGTQNPQHEYLYDEEGIERVYCFQILEKKRPAACLVCGGPEPCSHDFDQDKAQLADLGSADEVRDEEER